MSISVLWAPPAKCHRITVADLEAITHCISADRVVELQISAGHHFLWQTALWLLVEAAAVLVTLVPGEETAGILRALVEHMAQMHHSRPVVEARPLRGALQAVVQEVRREPLVRAQILTAITEAAVVVDTTGEAPALVLAVAAVRAIRLEQTYPPGRG
jgi:hypothetical protein